MAKSDNEGRGAAKPTQEGGSGVARVIEISARSSRSFEEAIQIDPSHAASWVGMAEVMSINAGVYSLAPARAAYAKAKDALAIAA